MTPERAARPIDWHEDCLKNMKAHLAGEESTLERQQRQVARLRDDVAFREKQIKSAKIMKKSKFNAEQFLKGQKP